jgi:hypothetical protein
MHGQVEEHLPSKHEALSSIPSTGLFLLNAIKFSISDMIQFRLTYYKYSW